METESRLSLSSVSLAADNGHVKEMPIEKAGMKRYQLTDSGKTLLEEQKKIAEERREKGAKYREEFRCHGRGRSHGPHFFGPPFMVPPWMMPPTETTAKVRGSVRQLMAALFELVCSAEERPNCPATQDPGPA